MATEKAPAEKKAPAPEMVWVVAVNADMLHLFTNVWFTKEPKKHEKDPFVDGQEKAGKLAYVQP